MCAWLPPKYASCKPQFVGSQCKWIRRISEGWLVHSLAGSSHPLPHPQLSQQQLNYYEVDTNYDGDHYDNCDYLCVNVSLIPWKFHFSLLFAFNKFHCSLRLFVKVPFSSRDISCSLKSIPKISLIPHPCPIHPHRLKSSKSTDDSTCGSLKQKRVRGIVFTGSKTSGCWSAKCWMLKCKTQLGRHDSFQHVSTQLKERRLE